MIMFLDSHEYSECCGCAGCHDVCPVHAISMTEAHDGFLYPKIDESICIHCQKCRNICAFAFNPASNEDYVTNEVYYGWLLKTEKRLNSTSGGAFISIANTFLDLHHETESIIYGAAWRDSSFVAHIGLKNSSDISLLSRSKYIRSSMVNIYEEIRDALRKGRYVLFSGLPCQVAELYTYLGQRYEKQLLTVDLICNGVASPLVFKDYISALGLKKRKKVIKYTFRNKVPERKSQKFINIEYADGTTDKTENDLFYIAYQKRLLHPHSCFRCPYTQFNHKSDITLGDFWHLEEKIVNLTIERPYGISMVLCNTSVGSELVKNISDMSLQKTELDFIDFGEVMNETLINKKSKQFFDSYSPKTVYKNLTVNIGVKELLSRKYPGIYSLYKLIVHK